MDWIIVRTLYMPLSIQKGDYIRLNGDTNKVRRIIDYITDYNGTVNVFYRPSRGYARHVRRMKAAQRK